MHYKIVSQRKDDFNIYELCKNLSTLYNSKRASDIKFVHRVFTGNIALLFYMGTKFLSHINKKSIKADTCNSHSIQEVKNSFGKILTTPQKTLTTP